MGQVAESDRDVDVLVTVEVEAVLDEEVLVTVEVEAVLDEADDDGSAEFV